MMRSSKCIVVAIGLLISALLLQAVQSAPAAASSGRCLPHVFRANDHGSFSYAPGNCHREADGTGVFIQPNRG